MNTLKLFIPINPKAKQSFRFTKTGMKFQSKDVIDYKNTLQSVIISQLPPDFEPFQKGLMVKYEFAYPFPSTMPKRFKETMMKEHGMIFRSKKQDLDNLQKAINDAMNGLVFKDDSLICSADCIKYYSDKPGTTLYIDEIGNYF